MEVRRSLDAIVREVGGRGPDYAISDETRIFHDMRIYGDDAYELLEAIAKTFGTRFDGFDGQAYIPNQGDLTGIRIARLFGRRFAWRPLTFGHLLNVVEAGQIGRAHV